MNKIEELIAKYNEGLSDPSEVQQLEKLIEEGKVAITQLRELNKLDESMEKIVEPTPSQELDHKFYEMMSKEKKLGLRPSFSWSWLSDSVFSKIDVGALLVVSVFCTRFRIR